MIEPLARLGRTLDVSAGGARLESDRELSIGELLSVEIAFGSQIVHAEARVVHVSPPDDELAGAGVVFDRVPAPDRETLSALGYAG